MRSARLLGSVAIVVLSVPGLIRAEDLTTVSDLDLLAKTREAVEAQDADGSLQLLTEMQRRGVGIFARQGAGRCEEVIDLPEGIADWRFKGAARQAYITAAKEHRLAEKSCACLFDGYGFDAFTAEHLDKAPADLVDADRAALEAFLTEHQRDTETAYRALEHSCRAK
jgi:hypothetical protein